MPKFALISLGMHVFMLSLFVSAKPALIFKAPALNVDIVKTSSTNTSSYRPDPQSHTDTPPAAAAKALPVQYTHNTAAASRPAPIPQTPENTDNLQHERLNHLHSLLRMAINEYFIYPPLARRYGWQGRVEVALQWEADGRLRPLRIAQSSGYPVLDQDAFNTLMRIGALPQAKQWLQGRSYEMQLPVVYKLIEG